MRATEYEIIIEVIISMLTEKLDWMIILSKNSQYLNKLQYYTKLLNTFNFLLYDSYISILEFTTSFDYYQ
jgi:hypothetical protein